MPHELEPLALAAGKSVNRLAEPQITEADFLQQFQTRPGSLCGFQIRERRQKFNGFIHGGFEHVADGPFQPGAWRRNFDFKNMRAITAPVAVGAADENVAEKL